MYSLFIFFVVIITALFSGALVSYPLYLLINAFTQVPFHSVIAAATQICGLVFALIYLKYTDSLNSVTVGFHSKDKIYAKAMVSAFLAGLIIIFLIAISVTLPGIYTMHPGRTITLTSIAVLFLSAIITGFTVSLFEETLFRGALLQGLRVKTNTTTAIVATSLVYAAVHFIKYPESETNINFFTALNQFVSAYVEIFRWEFVDAFGSLFILGALLGLIRVRTNSIVLCICLHAGIVSGIKLFRFFLEYKPGNDFDFLVSSHDYRLGIIASLWLGLATVLYYIFFFKNRPNG